MEKLKNEPVAIAALIQAAVALLVAFVPMTAPQVAALVAFSTAATGLLVRSLVTPVRKLDAAPKPPSVPPLALFLLALWLGACSPLTPSQATTAKTIVEVVEAGCVAAVSAKAPGFEGFCAVGADGIDRIIAANTAPDPLSEPRLTGAQRLTIATKATDTSSRMLAAALAVKEYRAARGAK